LSIVALAPLLSASADSTRGAAADRLDGVAPCEATMRSFDTAREMNETAHTRMDIDHLDIKSPSGTRSTFARGSRAAGRQ
jgi:hypothetical protein